MEGSSNFSFAVLPSSLVSTVYIGTHMIQNILIPPYNLLRNHRQRLLKLSSNLTQDKIGISTEFAGLLVKDAGADQVGGQQVGRKLNAVKLRIDSLR